MTRTPLALMAAALLATSGAALADDAEQNIESPSDKITESNHDNYPDAMHNGEEGDAAEHNDGLMGYQLSELEGMTVVNRQGEEIGHILRIVERKGEGELNAIVSIGGMWNIGDSEVALALDSLTLDEDQLVTNTPYGSDEIEASAERYDEDNFSQIDNDMTVEEVTQHPN